MKKEQLIEKIEQLEIDLGMIRSENSDLKQQLELNKDMVMISTEDHNYLIFQRDKVFEIEQENVGLKRKEIEYLGAIKELAVALTKTLK